MKYTGTVVQLNSRQAVVELCLQTGCESCSRGVGCGAGIFNQLWKLWGTAPQMTVIGPANTAIGNRLDFVVDDVWLTRVAALGFFLPTFSLVLCTIGASAIGKVWGFSGDPAAVIGAVIGLSSGIVIARSALKRVLRESTPLADFSPQENAEYSMHPIIRS